MTLEQWAIRWGVSINALEELRQSFGTGFTAPAPVDAKPHSEAYNQSIVRLEAADKNILLYRNNVGAVLTEKGMIRYGLANDSKKVNKVFKSSDLIGIKAVKITPIMVGTIIGQFVSREMKKSEWQYSGSEPEIAQLNWLKLIAANGGDARFCTGVGTF